MSGSFGRSISGIMQRASLPSVTQSVKLKVTETGLTTESSEAPRTNSHDNSTPNSSHFLWDDISLVYKRSEKEPDQWIELNISTPSDKIIILPHMTSAILSRFERYGSPTIKSDTGKMWELYEKSIRRSPFTNTIIFLTLIIVFGIFWSSLTVVEHFIVDSFVPISAGKALGTAYLPQFRGEKADAHPDVARAVERIGRRLIEKFNAEDSKNFASEINFTVIKDDNINAFALPGGHIVVFTGLVKACETEDQLASIIAHELSHIVNRDGLKAVASQIKWQVLAAFIGGDLGADQQFLFEQVKSLSSLRYSRKTEQRADLEGLLLMHKAGFDIADAGRFFNILASKGETIHDQFNFMSDHPPTKTRIKTLNEISATLEPIPYEGNDSKKGAQWQKIRTLASE
jgi:Zn-dependent protease with chaperone function